MAANNISFFLGIIGGLLLLNGIIGMLKIIITIHYSRKSREDCEPEDLE